MGVFMVRFHQLFHNERDQIVWGQDYAVTHLVFGDGHVLTVDGGIESTLTVLDNADRT